MPVTLIQKIFEEIFKGLQMLAVTEDEAELRAEIQRLLDKAIKQVKEIKF